MENKPNNGETLNSHSPLKKNEKLWILLGVLALMVIIVVIVAAQSKKSNKSSNHPSTNSSKTTNISKGNSSATTTPVGEKATATEAILKDATIVAPGANPITVDKKVVTASGEVTRNDVSAASPLAPEQTLAVSPAKLSSAVIKITESKANGFSPDSFTVKAGSPVALSLTNTDNDRSATLAFSDPSMSAVILGVGHLETRVITFNAPTKPGTYEFLDGIPGHTATGKMIVK